MSQLLKSLRETFSDEGSRYAYVEAHLNASIASQLKSLRGNMSQQELAEQLGTKQSGISRLESANYSSWKVETLRKYARVFGVRLRISFEEFGTLIPEIETFGKRLHPRRFEEDPVFQELAVEEPEQKETFRKAIEEAATRALFDETKTGDVPTWDLAQLGSDAIVFQMKHRTQELAGSWQYDIHTQEPASDYKGIRLIPNRPAQQAQTALNPPDEVSAQASRVA